MRLAGSSLSLLTKMRRNLVLIFVGGFDSLRTSLLAGRQSKKDRHKSGESME